MSISACPKKKILIYGTNAYFGKINKGEIKEGSLGHLLPRGSFSAEKQKTRIERKKENDKETYEERRNQSHESK
jgi:hypothetical protein